MKARWIGWKRLSNRWSRARWRLEDLIVRYEEGMKLVKVCQERLASAEQRIEIITRNQRRQTGRKDFRTRLQKATLPMTAEEKRKKMTKSDSSETASGARLLDSDPLAGRHQGAAEKDLPQLAQEVRDELIKVLSQTGGHLGPNLGVVELTIALHRVFETPKDKFVFDVSHQGYVHKMFTGRLDRIHTMRQYEGLNGFLLRTESEHDCYGAGHAGTALSAGLGMAVGRDLRGGDEHVVVVAGDAAFTCGISYEALNNANRRRSVSSSCSNDNEWSIAKNVGAIANYLNNIVDQSDLRASARKGAAVSSKTIAGKTAVHLAHKVEEGVKNLLVPSVIFEELGLRYYGPIDGHDIPLLIRTFEFLKTQDEPVLLHILTKKGKGYEPAIGKAGQISRARQIQNRKRRNRAAPTPTYSEIIGKTLAKFADTNQEDRRDHGGDAERNGPRIFPGAASGPLFRCRHRGGTRGAFCLRPGDAGLEAIPDDLLDFHAARLRHDHSRHRASESQCRALHGSRRIERR